MSENKPETDMKPVETPESENREKSAKKQIKPRKFLIVYIFALLLTALALVILSYLNQVRTSRTQIADLTAEHNLFSVSALGSIDKLTTQLDDIGRERDAAAAERDSLKAGLTALEKERDELKSENASLESRLSDVYCSLDDVTIERDELAAALDILTKAEQVIAECGAENYAHAAKLVGEIGEKAGETVLKEYPSLFEKYRTAVETLEIRN